MNPEVEAALAVIRDEETHPARPDGAPVPDHAPDLLGALQRTVDAARGERGRCSHPLCPFSPTRQTYSERYDPADPWNADGFDLWCAGHAPRDSWPAAVS